MEPPATRAAPQRVNAVMGSTASPSSGIKWATLTVTNGVRANIALTLDASIWAIASAKLP